MGLTFRGRRQPISTLLFKSRLRSPRCLWETAGQGLKVEGARWRR